MRGVGGDLEEAGHQLKLALSRSSQRSPISGAIAPTWGRENKVTKETPVRGCVSAGTEPWGSVSALGKVEAGGSGVQCHPQLCNHSWWGRRQPGPHEPLSLKNNNNNNKFYGLGFYHFLVFFWFLFSNYFEIGPYYIAYPKTYGNPPEYA